jgi:hypothetical protein
MGMLKLIRNILPVFAATGLVMAPVCARAGTHASQALPVPALAQNAMAPIVPGAVAASLPGSVGGAVASSPVQRHSKPVVRTKSLVGGSILTFLMSLGGAGTLVYVNEANKSRGAN